MNTCPTCTRVFKTPQGLAGHTQFKHPTEEAALTRRTITRGPAAQRPVSEELETLLKAVPNLFFAIRSLREELADIGGDVSQLRQMLNELVTRLDSATAEPVDAPQIRVVR